MPVSRRTLERDAEWVRRIMGALAGALGLVLCLIVIVTRTRGRFGGWSGAWAACISLLAWYILTLIGWAIGGWIGRLMLGVAHLKRRQEIREIEERAKMASSKRGKEEQILILTPDLLTLGMRTAKPVTASDGTQIVATNTALNREMIQAILDSDATTVAVKTAVRIEDE